MANTPSLRTHATAYIETLSGKADAVRELEAVRRVFADVPELPTFLQDVSIGVSDKQKAIHVALPDVGEETSNLILLLAKAEVVKQLDALIGHVKEIVAASEGRTFAEVRSAIPLTTDELTRVASALQKRLGTPVLIDTVLEPSILGGIQVRIGDWMFDASLKGRMQRLKQHLTV